MKPSIDDLLEQGLLEPPPGFERRVMARIAAEPRAKAPPARIRRALQWLALLAGAAFGGAQLLAFAFGTWTVAVAY